MDRETREFLEQQFATIDQRFTRVESEFRSELRGVRQDVAEKFEETKRHVGVVVEGLRGEIRQVAEGHDAIRREIRELREENEAAHRDLNASIKFVYGDVDRRVRILEGEA